MKKIAVARDLVTATHREASASIAALHPDADGGLDLLFALERCIHSMLDGDALPIRLGRRGNAQPMSMSTRDLLFQVGREAMTNVLRHSHATEATLSLCYEAKQVRLEVCDDGVGFDPATRASGFGLRTMQRRCEKIGAELKIITNPGEGSTVAVSAPYGVGDGLWQRFRSLVWVDPRRFSGRSKL
jgi:signal transduction histidine kinase